MADNHFDLVIVWDNLGGAVRVNAGGQATVTDPATGALVTVVQNGQSVSTVTADANGRASFVAQQGIVKLTSGGLSMTAVSAEQATAGAANAAAAQDAQLAAENARDAAIAARDDTTTGLTAKVDKAAAGYVMPTLPLTITTLQAAADSAATNGLRLVASGSITTSTTLTVACDADLGELTINYTGSGVAVRIGATATNVQRVTVRAPKVLASNKAATGWVEVAGTVGVELANLYSSQVTIPLVRGFESGLQFKGYGPSGTAYVNVMLGHLDNNKRNMVFTADATGYANQNTIIGGRCSHNSSEGTVVAGTRHVLFVSTANPINNNTFVGTSIESPNVVEYHIDCYGTDNAWVMCRFENTGANARVVWRANAKGNAIFYGFGTGSLDETREAGTANDIYTRQQHRFTGGNSANPTVVLENTFSSGAPMIVGMASGAFAAGTDPSTGWTWRVNASQLSGKSAADTEDRVRLDFANSRVYLGPGGATAPTVYLGKTTVGLVSSGPMQVGAYATGSRPSASAAGAGAMAYDTTLGKPIWSNGTTWRDATGTAV